MKNLSENESMALQDLLEMDAIFEEEFRGTEGEKRASLIRNYLTKVRAKAKKLPAVDFPPNCDWLNTSESWTQDHLKGRISLLDFWTYCCINCMHILPDLEEVEEVFGKNDNIVVIGVHSAKFDNERVGDNISNAIQRYGIHHPVINDSQAILWNFLSVSCWPTVVLCDPDAKPIKFFVGEGHRQDMIDFAKMAQELFKEEMNSAQKMSLPTVEIGLTHIESILRFPGKVLTKDDLIYISDTGNHRIIVASLEGVVKTVIGDGKKGHIDGNFGESRFNSPQGLAVYGKKLYVADTNNHVLRSIDLDENIVATIAGNGKQCVNSQIISGKGGLEVSLASPWDLVKEEENTLLIAMAGSHQIWRMDLDTGNLALVAGSGKEENRNNSYPLKASFAQPSGLSWHQENLYIADSESSTIRVFNAKNGVKNVCGGSKNPMDLFGYGDSDGKGTEAKLQHPLGVAMGGDDRLFVADSYNHKLKMVTELSSKTPLCSSCPVTGLNEPGGLCYDGQNTLYVADTNNHCIKKLNIEDFQVSVLKLEMPASSDNVDFPADSSQIIKVKKGHGFKIALKLPSHYALNQDAPNQWKLPPTQKGSIGPDLTFSLGPLSEDISNLSLKLYLCHGQICTVRHKQITIHQEQSIDIEDFIIDV